MIGLRGFIVPLDGLESDLAVNVWMSYFSSYPRMTHSHLELFRQS